MTNEEARRILLYEPDFNGFGEEAKLTEEALSVAIEALESIDRITAERDAAVADLKEASRHLRYHFCPYCKHFKAFDISKEPCHSCNYGRKNWEWRGIEWRKRNVI